MSIAASTIHEPAKTRVPPYTPKKETYWYMDHRWLFDVDKANLIVRDGREPVEVDEQSVRLAVKESEITPEHVEKTNADVPGIIAHVRYRTDDGELLKGHVMIDGHHRAARCLKEKRPFFAWLLSEHESLQVLLRCPEDSLPDAAEAAELKSRSSRQRLSAE